MELGPSGTAFRKAARVQLPVSAERCSSAGSPRGAHHRPGQRRLGEGEVPAVDAEQGIVTAEIEHFSTYVVAPEISLLAGKLSRGAAGTACERSLVVRAPLSVPPIEAGGKAGAGSVPASFVNGYTGNPDGDLDGVLAAMTPGPDPAGLPPRDGAVQGWAQPSRAGC